MTCIMKYKIAYTLFVALLALSACTKDEKKYEYSPDMNITFSPAVTVATRAMSAAYPVDMPFGIWAYRLPYNQKWDNATSEPALLLENSRVTCLNDIWQPEPSIKWPGNEKLTFFAYAPYDANMTFSRERGVEFNDFDATSGIIPMYTSPITDCDKELTNGCVALPFIQTLTKVEFKVCSSIANVGFRIFLKSMVIDNIAQRGSFNSLPEPVWGNLGDKRSLELCSECMEVGMSLKTVGFWMLLPQSPKSAIKMIVDIYDDKGELYAEDFELTTDVIKDTWGVGKYYTYNIVLSDHGATFTTDIFDSIK